MKYYYGNDYKEAIKNEPVEINSPEDLAPYKAYAYVTPVMCINHTTYTLPEALYQRVCTYPQLKICVDKFIEYNGNSEKTGCIDDLTYYIKRMDYQTNSYIDIPELFGWDKETADDFYSWGHNSRYANVMQPMLWDNFEEYVEAILNWLDNSGSQDESFMFDLEI